MYIIIKNKNKLGKTRSERETNLRKSGFGRTMSDEDLDKCKYLEKKSKEEIGAKYSDFTSIHFDKIK